MCVCYKFTKCKVNEQKKNLNQINIWFHYPLLSNQHQFLQVLLQSQGFCRITVRGMINQLYQTGANDHQFYM